ncbi:MAG: hypothetical protein ACYC8V_09580 [Caulobacteraceae bacterium]
MKLLFAFNHAEAIRSFREAARFDPNCAMCWWGVAFALGPKLDLAIWFQARAFAHADTGDLAAARVDRDRLVRLTSGDSTTYANAGLPAARMAALALALVDGEIARVSGHLGDAIARFQIAAGIERRSPIPSRPTGTNP